MSPDLKEGPKPKFGCPLIALFFMGGFLAGFLLVRTVAS
jgi:hypothetical protein